MTEEWRPVPGYEETYQVSSEGRVRRLDSGRVLRPGTGSRGQLIYCLSLDGTSRTHTAGRLVCSAWHGPANDRRAVHINEIADDDRPENLRWE